MSWRKHIYRGKKTFLSMFIHIHTSFQKNNELKYLFTIICAEYRGCSLVARAYTFIMKSGISFCWPAKQEVWSFPCGQKTWRVVFYSSQWRTGAVECGPESKAGVCLRTGRAACVRGVGCGPLSGLGGLSLSWGHQPSRFAFSRVAEASGPPGQQFSIDPEAVSPECK